MYDKIDYGLYIIIPVIYNLIIHVLASTLTQNMPYKERYSNSLTLIIVAGLLALVIYNMYYDEEEGTQLENVIYQSLGLGGILLIITAILIDWQQLGDVMQVIIISTAFIMLFYFHYKKKMDDD